MAHIASDCWYKRAILVNGLIWELQFIGLANLPISEVELEQKLLSGLSQVFFHADPRTVFRGRYLDFGRGLVLSVATSLTWVGLLSYPLLPQDSLLERPQTWSSQRMEHILICCVCLGDNSEDADEIIQCDNCGVTVHEGEIPHSATRTKYWSQMFAQSFEKLMLEYILIFSSSFCNAEPDLT